MNCFYCNVFSLRRLAIVGVLCIGLVFECLAQKKGKAPEITIEDVKQKCQNLPASQRILVQVARFSVSTKAAQAHATFGDELATMLTSALQQTTCFRILETNKNLSDATSSMTFAMDGFTNGSGPQAGQMLGPQLIVTGEITDFSEGSSSKSILVVESKSNQATVGFNLKVLNPQTGELLFSEDVNMKGHNSGKVVNIFGVQTSSSNENRAVQDALQKAITRAVEILADKKDQIDIPEPIKPKEFKRFNAQNCSMLRNGAPKVIILVTEATTEGTARLNQEDDFYRRQEEQYIKREEAITKAIGNLFTGKNRRGRAEEAVPESTTTTQTAATAQIKKVVIEQTATETELTRLFVEAGFRVIDPKVYGKMKQLSDSTGDLGQMAALGLKMGANIIITGQAISEKTNAQGGMTACRARIEIRVIATEDGSILATNTASAGGIDVSEAVANKVALRNASENMSQYLMERLCGINLQFTSAGISKKSEAKVREATPGILTELTVSNTNFAKLQIMAASLSKNPRVTSVKKSLKGTDGILIIEHSGTTDDLIENLTKVPSLKFDVSELEEGKARVAMQ